MKNKEITNEMPEVKRDANPFYAWETVVASHERVKMALIFVIGLLTVLCVIMASILGYGIHEWFQYDTVEYSYSQDGQGTNIIGNGNEVQHGSEVAYPYTDQEKR